MSSIELKVDGVIVYSSGAVPPPLPNPVPVSNGDPGHWTGTWFPATWPDGTSNGNHLLMVVDPSGVRGVGGVSVIPAAQNQGDPSPNVVNQAGPAIWQAGQCISVRHHSDSHSSPGYFQLYSMSGSGVTLDMSISLSTVPGDFGPNCLVQSRGTGNPMITYGTAGGIKYSDLLPDTDYYFNIKANIAGTHRQFNFSYQEPNGMKAP